MAEQVKNNPKVGFEKNFFMMTGTIEYRPNILATKADKKPMASILLSQTRQAGANYEEYTRRFQVISFDQKVIDLLMSLYGKVKVEFRGNISLNVETFERYGKPQRVSMARLVATDMVILEDLNEQFTLTRKEKGEQQDSSEAPIKPTTKVSEPPPSPKAIEALVKAVDEAELLRRTKLAQAKNPKWTLEMEKAHMEIEAKEQLKKKPVVDSLEIADEDLPF
jgi:hypothetical protein